MKSKQCKIRYMLIRHS